MEETPGNVSGSMDAPLGKPDSFFDFPSKFHFGAPAAKQWIGQRRENVRPWTTFMNTSNFKTPASLPRLSKRIVRNIEYFQSNYLFVFIGLILYCLLTSPLLLIAVGISLVVAYKLSSRQAERKIKIVGYELTLAQQYALVGVCSIPLFIWAGATTALFWVLGASFVILQSQASFLCTTYIKTFGVGLVSLIFILKAFLIDFLFFCLYYVGASFFIITLHAAFFNIEAVVNNEDTFGLTLEEV